MPEDAVEDFSDREALTNEVIEACQHTGLISVSAAQWIAEIIFQNEGRGWTVVEREVRDRGDAIDEPDRRALKAPTNLKLGAIYVTALTEAGRKRPGDAALLVVHRVIHTRHIRRQLEKWRTMELPSERVALIPANDSRTCAAAFEVARKIFTIHDAPEPPLPSCEAELCRCYYGIVGLSGTKI